MQELNLPGEDGKRILYPRMKLYGQVNLETITLGSGPGDQGPVRMLGDKVFKDCINLKTIKNLNIWHPHTNNKVDQIHPWNRLNNCDYLFYNCKKLKIESSYSEHIIAPLLKCYFFKGTRPDKEYRVGKFAFGYCDFSYVGGVDIYRYNSDYIGNRYTYRFY